MVNYYRIHGHASKGRSLLYMTWSNMKYRCSNPNAPAFHRYGGRGIRVCQEWAESYAAFLSHVSQLPHYGEHGRSLDRIDNDGNYEPGNVRWATAKEQAQNRSSTARKL